MTASTTIPEHRDPRDDTIIFYISRIVSHRIYRIEILENMSMTGLPIFTVGPTKKSQTCRNDRSQRTKRPRYGRNSDGLRRCYNIERSDTGREATNVTFPSLLIFIIPRLHNCVRRALVICLGVGYVSHGSRERCADFLLGAGAFSLPFLFSLSLCLFCLSGDDTMRHDTYLLRWRLQNTTTEQIHE